VKALNGLAAEARFKLFLTVAIVTGFLGMATLEPKPAPMPPALFDSKVPVEEARYMLECTQEWGLTADECRAVLHGEDPPRHDETSGC
jgi:hypothetical protein